MKVLSKERRGRIEVIVYEMNKEEFEEYLKKVGLSGSEIKVPSSVRR